MSEHAIREYLKTIGNGGGGVSQETDPVFTASPAHGISAQDIADWNDKQDELVSGTNIKTINGQSLLGSGDLPVAPPVTSTDVPTADTIAEFDSDAHMNSTDMSDSDVSDFIDGLNVGGRGMFDVLFNVPTSNPVTSATLSSSVANYKRLKIFGISVDNHFASVEIYNNNSNSLITSLNNGSFSGSAFYLKTARIQINGTALTVDRGTNVNIASSFSYSAGTTVMRVYRVEGYYM